MTIGEKIKAYTKHFVQLERKHNKTGKDIALMKLFDKRLHELHIVASKHGEDAR